VERIGVKSGAVRPVRVLAFRMMGVLLLGLLLVLALLLCSILRAGLPAALSVASIMVGLMVVAGGGGMAGAIIGGGAILIGGLVLATASETYEEIRLARRLTKPRRRPRVTTLPEAEPESHEHSRAA
jgi:hypothetical protein